MEMSMGSHGPIDSFRSTGSSQRRINSADVIVVQSIVVAAAAACAAVKIFVLMLIRFIAPYCHHCHRHAVSLPISS